MITCIEPVLPLMAEPLDKVAEPLAPAAVLPEPMKTTPLLPEEEPPV